MVAFVTGAGYRLPFTTSVVDRFTLRHRHRDCQNFSWIEDMILTVSVPDLHSEATFAANNDNEAGNYA